MNKTHHTGNKPWQFFPESKTKGCTKCERVLPWSAFAKSSKAKTGLQSVCRECISIHQKALRLSDRQGRREVEIRARAKSVIPDKWRFARQRARKKGVPICTLAEFIEWHSKQKLECVYCSMVEADAIRAFGHRLHIDRREAALGYVVSNIQLACHRCNLTKNKYLTHEQMREIAQKYFSPCSPPSSPSASPSSA